MRQLENGRVAAIEDRNFRSRLYIPDPETGRHKLKSMVIGMDKPYTACDKDIITSDETFG